MTCHSTDGVRSLSVQALADKTGRATSTDTFGDQWLMNTAEGAESMRDCRRAFEAMGIQMPASRRGRSRVRGEVARWFRRKPCVLPALSFAGA